MIPWVWLLGLMETFMSVAHPSVKYSDLTGQPGSSSTFLSLTPDFFQLEISVSALTEIFT